MDFTSFIERIHSIEKKPQRYFIVDPELTLSVYFGLDNMSRPTLRIEDIGKTFSASDLPSTAQILVTSFKQEGKACLSFSLLVPEHRDIFNTLCYDLCEATRKATREQALVGLLARFSEWQDLLKGTRSGLLSLQEQLGLVGELQALLYYINTKGFDNALDAWVGPFKLDKDFEFCDSWAEVKSCKVSATTITISSIEQLDSETEGELLVYHIDRAPENSENAFSLKNLVDEIRRKTDTAAMRTKFDKMLMLAHYYDGVPEYEKKQFKIYSRDIYKVSPDFPCIRRATLFSTITACQYSLSLPAIEKYKKEV